MAVGIGAAVAITAFSACIAPWLDRQNSQNGDDQESRTTPDDPSKAVCQLQAESFKSLFINGLRKLSSVCLPSVDMTGSLQYFVSKPFVDIDINIISQSTQTDADSTYFTAAAEETRSTYESTAFGESEKTHQMTSPSSSSRSPAYEFPQNQKILIPRIQKPPRAHPPRKSTDSAVAVASRSVQTAPVPKENLGNSETKESVSVQHQSADPSEKDPLIQHQSTDESRNETSIQYQSADPSNNDLLLNKNNHHDPSSTIGTSVRPRTFEVLVSVHKDASTAAGFDKNQPDNSRVSSAPDHNNNSSLHDHYKNNLNYVSSMGGSFDHFVQSSNIGRSSANIGGSSSNIGRSSGSIGRSSANIGGSSANIEESSSNDISHKHHSSSFITRIRVVLSRYFHFGEKSHKSRNASGRLKGMCSKVQTESSGSSSRTGDTIIHYPGQMSSCIVQDLNSENDKSRLSFSAAEVTSSTRIADEAPGAFDPVRDRSESRFDSFIGTKRVQNMRTFGFDQNRNKSGKFQGILSDGNFRNSRTTISNSGTEYPTFEIKKGIFRKLRGFFQRDKSKKLSFLGESKFRETFDGKLSDNFFQRSVLCTEL